MKNLFAAIVLAMSMAIPAYAAVNLNTATQAELEAVKGIGPSKAKAIIAYREKNGGFKSVDELANVKGFGKASVEKLKGEFEVPAGK
ncbi:MAG: ComEA family DNA-binding protein [Gallionellaceae bacterium]|nr:ComEA family DNA-binding protein [Gallionellaceae bacterium]